MYKIFLVVNVCFGEINCIEYKDKDLANTVWKDLMTLGKPIITVKDNEFRVWNAPFKHQPEKIKDLPEWADKEWASRKYSSDNYLGAELLDMDNIGCYILRHKTRSPFDPGLIVVESEFYTYKGEKMFTHIEYD